VRDAGFEPGTTALPVWFREISSVADPDLVGSESGRIRTFLVGSGSGRLGPDPDPDPRLNK
jgi:hypothetical protein